MAALLRRRGRGGKRVRIDAREPPVDRAKTSRFGYYDGLRPQTPGLRAPLDVGERSRAFPRDSRGTLSGVPQDGSRDNVLARPGRPRYSAKRPMTLDFGINTGFVEELYSQYLENPASVEPDWRAYFDTRLAATNGSGGAATPRPFVERVERTLPIVNGELARSLDRAFVPAREPREPSSTSVLDRRGHERDVLAEAAIQARVYKLLNAYRVRGHLFAHIDPLGSPKPAPPELDLRNFDLVRGDLDKPFPTIDLAGMPPVATLRENPPGARGDVLPHHRRRVHPRRGSRAARVAAAGDGVDAEPPGPRRRGAAPHPHQAQRRRDLRAVHPAQLRRGHQALLARRAPRASSPCSTCSSSRPRDARCEEIVIGMAHRGRLNVLANIMGKSVREIFAAFEDADPERFLGGGDVKYHLGYSTDCVTVAGKNVHLTHDVQPEPPRVRQPRGRGPHARQAGAAGAGQRQRSALEALGPGARAGCCRCSSTATPRSWAQGIVAETLNLTGLRGYTTGGTVHVIVNNQIGFTTDPEDSRSTRYASDITRMLKVPVFHVNGEDPEAVAQVAHLAVEWRQRFAHGRGDRHVLLPPPRPQRGRRAALHPAVDVPGHRPQADRPPGVRQAPHRDGPRHREQRRRHRRHAARGPRRRPRRREAARLRARDLRHGRRVAELPRRPRLGHARGAHRGERRAHPRPLRAPRRAAPGLQRAPQGAAHPPGAARGHPLGRALRLGDRRDAGVRHPPRRHARRCASRARTCSAAPSATATPCSSTPRRARATPRSPAWPRPPAASRSTTAPSPSRACSASTSATASTSPRRW